MRGLGKRQHVVTDDSAADTNVTPEIGQSSFLTCKSRRGSLFGVRNGKVIGLRTGVAHARTVHLDETFTRCEVVGLLDGIVFADLNGGSRPGDNGCDLNLWDRHCRNEARAGDGGVENSAMVYIR